MNALRTLVLVTALWACCNAHAQIGDLSPPSAQFLIVAPKAFHETLQPYVHHKLLQLTTELISLESVLAGSEGSDDPEKVKRFLFAHWKRGTKYALLVGDADTFPVRYMVLDRVTPPAFDYAFYPSDLYYADLAKPDGSFEDWNASKEGFHAGYFGEVRGEKNKGGPINFDQIDYRAEIAVGRWPVSTTAEVKTIVDKSMAHERFAEQYAKGDTSPPLAGLIATGGWVENRPFFDKVTDRLSDAATRWRVEKRYWSGNGRDDKTPPPNEEQVVSLLNSGASMILHCGHGADDRWDGSLSVAGLKKVGNQDFAPVIMSAGCSTARFATLPPYEPYVDAAGAEHKGTNNGEVFTQPPPPPACYQRDKYNPTGLGEQLLRAGPSGAAAYIGCNTGSQPAGLTLMEGFVDALARAEQQRVAEKRTEMVRLGDCWSGAIAYYYDHQHLADLKPNDDWYPPSIFFQGMKFMLFGDPTLEMP